MEVDKPTVVLEKYDEEIDGLKKKSFKLGRSTLLLTSHLKYVVFINFVHLLLLGVDKYKVKRETVKEKLKKNLNIDSLNSSQLKLASDYYNASEMSAKFRKIKVHCIYIYSI